MSRELSLKQQEAFDKYIGGHNIFITGPGGSGKSEVIRMIRRHAMEHGKKMQVCALTGCAAFLLQCNAKTLHSWAGIGLGNKCADELLLKLPEIRKAAWRNIDVLVIDEVSMMSKKIMELLDCIARRVRRRRNEPFGGIQMIFSGDFFQLPPVGKKEDPETSQFCFESELWFNIFWPENNILLNKSFRQQADEEYASILNQVREGRLKRRGNDILERYVGRVIPEDEFIKPTKIYPTRAKVDAVNRTEMQKLQGVEHVFETRHNLLLSLKSEKERNLRNSFTPAQIEAELLYLQNSLLCDNRTVLKEGAQVMCVVTIVSDDAVSSPLCNGSRGIVTGFTESGWPSVRFDHRNSERVMTPHMWQSENIPGIGVCQVPLILAWALTIHKCQGATLETAEIDVGSGIFEAGQTYVALSRVKSLDGLYLTSYDVSKIRIHKKVADFYQLLKNQDEKMTNNSKLPS